jgi:FkbM family methyltransferase
MNIATVARKVIPDDLRTAVGVWTVNVASRNEVLLKAYLTVLHGSAPANMGLSDGYCYYDYGDRRILAPKNAAPVFMEIFEDEVYEGRFRPEPENIVLDIGAYVGMFTVKATLSVGERGRVVAVEPHPEHFSMLQDNCEGLDNVTLVPKAVMASNGTGRLYITKAAGADNLVTHEGHFVKVETVTLDQLVIDLQLPRIDFIKLDAEGAEVDVLKGGEETLKRTPRLVVAVYHTTAEGRDRLERVTAILNQAGYTVRVARGLRSYVYAEKTI